MKITNTLRLVLGGLTGALVDYIIHHYNDPFEFRIFSRYLLIGAIAFPVSLYIGGKLNRLKGITAGVVFAIISVIIMMITRHPHAMSISFIFAWLVASIAGAWVMLDVFDFTKTWKK